MPYAQRGQGLKLHKQASPGEMAHIEQAEDEGEEECEEATTSVNGFEAPSSADLRAFLQKAALHLMCDCLCRRFIVLQLQLQLPYLLLDTWMEKVPPLTQR
ncbi:hypothetical protein AB1Y20_021371 [Prymnesium parvum]|uniref:General transcription factor IIH subunit 4 n=1 Tax=Prymnesium parvum TaxID=97485 RepID=A0AB34JLU3_PRYPA